MRQHQLADICSQETEQESSNEGQGWGAHGLQQLLHIEGRTTAGLFLQHLLQFLAGSFADKLV